MKAGREEGALQNSVTGMQEYPKTIHGKWYLSSSGLMPLKDRKRRAAD